MVIACRDMVLFCSNIKLFLDFSNICLTVFYGSSIILVNESNKATRTEKGLDMAKGQSVYEIVTERITKMVEEKGILPWQRPWNVTDRFPANLERPETSYRGINFWILMMQGYQSPFWATFKQIKKMGGHVKKDEKGTLIVFWKQIPKDEDDETSRFKAILRYFCC